MDMLVMQKLHPTILIAYDIIPIHKRYGLWSSFLYIFYMDVL